MQVKLENLSEAENIRNEFKEFTYIVSHDFSGPMRSIIEFSRLLKTEHADVLNEEGQIYLTFLMENGEKLQRMLNGLIELSRLNMMAKAFTDVDLNLVLEQCRQTLAEIITEKNANLDISPLPTIFADPEQMLQLFSSLIDNALKFAGKQPSYIQISVQDGDEWLFTVRDNCMGIREKDFERIFQPFRRLHHEEDYPGTGMGLTMAKKIIEIHKGRIWLESTPGLGTAFMFTIPKSISPT